MRLFRLSTWCSNCTRSQNISSGQCPLAADPRLNIVKKDKADNVTIKKDESSHCFLFLACDLLKEGLSIVVLKKNKVFYLHIYLFFFGHMLHMLVWTNFQVRSDDRFAKSDNIYVFDSKFDHTVNSIYIKGKK